MRFFKMNGIGNDYIFIDRNEPLSRPIQTLAPLLTDRNYGIGGDGVVLYRSITPNLGQMNIYNRDGTEAEMCGNALRCIIRHLANDGKTYYVKTLSGILSGSHIGDIVTAKVAKNVSHDTEKYIISIDGKEICGKRAWVGNPHFVVMGKYDNDLAKKISENTTYFPNRTNVEFVQIKDNDIFVRVYERGCGETKACGTGAAAVFSLTGKNEAVIRLTGGDLTCKKGEKGEICQTGLARYNFKGEWTDVYSQ